MSLIVFYLCMSLELNFWFVAVWGFRIALFFRFIVLVLLLFLQFLGIIMDLLFSSFDDWFCCWWWLDCRILRFIYQQHVFMRDSMLRTNSKVQENLSDHHHISTSSPWHFPHLYSISNSHTTWQYYTMKIIQIHNFTFCYNFMTFMNSAYPYSSSVCF